MVFIPWGDLPQAVQNLPPFAAGAISAARSFTCGLARNYERYMVGPAPLDPLGALRRGMISSICPTPFPDSSPNLPPTGGDTCSCQSYITEIVITDSTGQSAPVVGSTSFTGPLFGLDTVTTGTTKTVSIVQGVCSQGQFTGTNKKQIFSGGLNNEVALRNIQKSGTILANCAFPKPNPQPVIQPPPPEAQRQPLPIQISPTTNIIIPVTLITPITNIRPSLDIEVNVGPVNVKFDLGGVTIDLAPNLNINIPINPTINLPPLPPTIPRPPELPPSGGGAICPDPCPEINFAPVFDRFDDVDDALKRIEKCSCDSTYTFSEQVLYTGDGAAIPLPVGTYRVRITIQQVSQNAKVEYGNGTSPDVYYAGWYSFGYGSVPGSRYPVSYIANEFPTPDGATSISFTVRKGYIASVTALIRTIVEEP